MSFPEPRRSTVQAVDRMTREVQSAAATEREDAAYLRGQQDALREVAALLPDPIRMTAYDYKAKQRTFRCGMCNVSWVQPPGPDLNDLGDPIHPTNACLISRAQQVAKATP